MDEEFETFTGKLCACGHLPHGNDKCYDMDFNGSVYSNCWCKETSQEFCLVLTPEEFQHVSRLQADRKFARAA